jgi:hypothetical protein
VLLLRDDGLDQSTEVDDEEDTDSPPPGMAPLPPGRRSSPPPVPSRASTISEHFEHAFFLGLHGAPPPDLGDVKPPSMTRMDVLLTKPRFSHGNGHDDLESQDNGDAPEDESPPPSVKRPPSPWRATRTDSDDEDDDAAKKQPGSLKPSDNKNSGNKSRVTSTSSASNLVSRWMANKQGEKRNKKK